MIPIFESWSKIFRKAQYLKGGLLSRMVFPIRESSSLSRKDGPNGDTLRIISDLDQSSLKASGLMTPEQKKLMKTSIIEKSRLKPILLEKKKAGENIEELTWKPRKLLTTVQMEQMRLLSKSGKSKDELSEHFKVSYSAVCRILGSKFSRDPKTAQTRDQKIRLFRKEEYLKAHMEKKIIVARGQGSKIRPPKLEKPFKPLPYRERPAVKFSKYFET
eukprot:Sdes_comp17703_c0_seq1m6976